MNSTPRAELLDGENGEKPVKNTPQYVFTLAVTNPGEPTDSLNSMWRLEMSPERREHVVKQVRAILDAILQENL